VHLACHTGNIPMLEYLLSIDGDINIKSNKGVSSFHLAIQHDQVQMVDLLVSKHEFSPTDVLVSVQNY